MTTAPTNFEVRKFQFGKIDELKGLMETCFGGEVSPRYFQWKYRDNPAGEVVGYSAYHEEKLVSFYGVIPETYLVNGKPTVFHQAMDLMTHPQYQRKGLFSLLGKKTYHEIEKEKGQIAVIGVPNYHILPGHVGKIGSKHIHSFPYIFSFRPFFRMASLLKKRLVSKIEFVPLTEITHEFEKYFEDRQPSPIAIAPVYTAEFIKWRLLKHPKQKLTVFLIKSDGKVMGFCGYEIDSEGRARILILDFHQRRYFGELTHSALKHLFDTTRVPSIYTWQPTDPSVASAYRSAGMMRNDFKKGPFSFKFPFIVYANPGTISGVKLDDISNFDLQPIIQD